MHVRRNAREVAVLAPAKINLFLEVLAKRTDGYHEIETLLLPISVFDGLTFRPSEQQRIVLECRLVAGDVARIANFDRSSPAAHELHSSEIPQGPENLVWKAAALLQQRAAVAQGAHICLLKRIPAAAGLGGASSDAAAALLAANLGWNLGWSTEHLRELASELGSDIPFFLAGGAGLGRGRGETIEKVRAMRLNVVVVKPPVGLCTPHVYRRCQAASNPRTAAAASRHLASGPVALLAGELHNQLEPAAAGLTPWIERLRDRFSTQGFYGHRMSGSGSSYFGICRSRKHGRRVAAILRAQSLGSVMLTETASNR